VSLCPPIVFRTQDELSMSSRETRSAQRISPKTNALKRRYSKRNCKKIDGKTQTPSLRLEV
jgi:hypothetical protein